MKKKILIGLMIVSCMMVMGCSDLDNLFSGEEKNLTEFVNKTDNINGNMAEQELQTCTITAEYKEFNIKIMGTMKGVIETDRNVSCCCASGEGFNHVCACGK